jgi:galactonate dehydratase
VPVYCHCPAGDGPEAFAENVKGCRARGYRALKTTLPLFYGMQDTREGAGGQIGYSGTRGAIDRDYRETEYLDTSIWGRIGEFFVAAREAGGPEMGLAVDCHGRLNLKNAVRLCRALEGVGMMFVEEPVPPENAEVLAEVKRSTAIPIAAGERWATIYGAREFVEQGAVDILQCDLVNCGGITGLKKIAALAEAHYIGMAPHNPNGPLATAMNVQFAATIPNYLILETVGGRAETGGGAPDSSARAGGRAAQCAGRPRLGRRVERSRPLPLPLRPTARVEVGTLVGPGLAPGLSKLAAHASAQRGSAA